jgi:steroid 5-alpha reductase family enzyme
MTPDAAWLKAAGLGLGAGMLLALAVWAMSAPRRDVSIVDIAWGFLVLVSALVVAALLPHDGPRAAALLGLAAAWALRLSAYIAWRHRGQPEDRRYQAIRGRNQPHFAWKSLYLVFGLQALLGWIVAAPLMAGVVSPVPWNMLDALGLALAAFGLVFEAVADAQMARFRADPRNRGRVMDRGLWRFSRHPNYFGECCFWWGLWGVAAAGGAWWTVVSPLLMTVLLLKVSGVPLLEQDLGRHRPGYADYVRRTPAFVPWRVRG